MKTGLHRSTRRLSCRESAVDYRLWKGFVSVHFRDCYNLTKYPLDGLFDNVPEDWSRLAVFQGFQFEQEPLFLYRLRSIA